MSRTTRGRQLLDVWRQADRRWEATPADDPRFEDARQEVLQAWMAYQAASASEGSADIVLVADNAMRYVAANEPACHALGYSADEIVGMSVTDLTLPADHGRALALWDEFRLIGRQEGEYFLRTRSGDVLQMRYLARAHFPVADLHTSRLTPIGGVGRPG